MLKFKRKFRRIKVKCHTVLYYRLLYSSHVMFSTFLTTQMLTHLYMFTNINRTFINPYCFTNTFILINIGIPSVQVTHFFLTCPLKRYVILFMFLPRHFFKGTKNSTNYFAHVLNTQNSSHVEANWSFVPMFNKYLSFFFCEMIAPLPIPTVSSPSFCV